MTSAAADRSSSGEGTEADAEKAIAFESSRAPARTSRTRRGAAFRLGSAGVMGGLALEDGGLLGPAGAGRHRRGRGALAGPGAGPETATEDLAAHIHGGPLSPAGPSPAEGKRPHSSVSRRSPRA